MKRNVILPHSNSGISHSLSTFVMVPECSRILRHAQLRTIELDRVFERGKKASTGLSFFSSELGEGHFPMNSQPKIKKEWKTIKTQKLSLY